MSCGSSWHAASLSVVRASAPGENRPMDFQEDLRAVETKDADGRTRDLCLVRSGQAEGCSLLLALLRELLFDDVDTRARHRYRRHRYSQHPVRRLASVSPRCRVRRRSHNARRASEGGSSAIVRLGVGALVALVVHGVPVRVQRWPFAAGNARRHAADDVAGCEGLREGDVRLREALRPGCCGRRVRDGSRADVLRLADRRPRTRTPTTSSTSSSAG